MKDLDAEEGRRAPAADLAIGRLARQLGRDRRKLLWLDEAFGESEPVPRGAWLFPGGPWREGLIALQAGWAGLYCAVAEPPRLAHLRLPGEIIGPAWFGENTDAPAIRMLSQGRVRRLPEETLRDLAETRMEAVALLAALARREAIAAQERLARLTARSAQENLAAFLLDLHARLELTTPGIGRRFPAPLRQSEIGQLIGVTETYANRLLKGLAAEGLIEIERPYFRIPDVDALSAWCGYRNLHAPVAASSD